MGENNSSKNPLEKAVSGIKNNTDTDTPENVVYIMSEHPEVTPENPVFGPEYRPTRENGYEIAIQTAFYPENTLDMGDEDYQHLTLPNGKITLYRTSDPKYAVAISAGMCETFGVSENEFNTGFKTKNELSETAFNSFNEWNNNLTTRERKLRLLTYAENKQKNPVVKHHLDNGSFRTTTTPTGSQKRYALSVYADSEGRRKPQKCYQNALNTLLGKTEDDSYLDNDRVQYCEGMFFSRHGCTCVSHAWLEVDGYPIEFTYDWHRPLPEPAVYFGVEVDSETIENAIEYARKNDGSLPTPLTVDEETLEPLQDDPGRKAVDQATTGF